MTALCRCGQPAKNGKYCSAACAPYGFLCSQRYQRPELHKTIPPGKLTAKDLGAQIQMLDSQVYMYAREGKIPFEKSPETGIVFDLVAVRAAIQTAGIKRRGAHKALG